MSVHKDLGAVLCGKLREKYTLRQEDIGADARLSKKGMVFETESYAVEGLGHLCVLRMKAMLGLMKMETVVLACEEKDLPLFNLDYVNAMGKETQIAELYDVQLAPWPEEAQAAFTALKARDADLPDPPAQGAHWYDAILYPCSYHKAGKKIGARLDAAAAGYMDAFFAQLESAPDCAGGAKREKIRAYAEELFRQGGPAVDTMAKLFGREVTGRIILRCMYGVRP